MLNLRNKRQSLLPYCVAAVFVATLPACGGGGGGKGTSGTPATTNEPGGTTDNNGSIGLNGELTGYIYYTAYDGKQIKLDLQTGIEQEVPFLNAYGWGNRDALSYAVDSRNQQIIKSFPDYEFGTGYTARIETVNANNEFISDFTVSGGLVHYMSSSPDGSVLALDWDIDFDTIVSLFDRAGNELWTFANNGNLKGFDWMPDSSGLLLAYGSSLYKVNLANLSQNVLVKNFENNGIFGAFDAPRVSPDGQRLAFTANVGRGYYTDNHVFISDFNGDNIRQLTTSVDGEGLTTWSSDGKYVFVLTGTGMNQIVVRPSCSKALYAVKADAGNAFLSPDIVGTSGPAFPIRHQTEGGAIERVCLAWAVKQPEWNF